MRDQEYLRLEVWCSYLPHDVIGGYQKDETKVPLVYFDEQEQTEAKKCMCRVVDEIFESARRMRAAKGIEERQR